MVVNRDDNHERWAQLAAGHVLASLDDADEAAYLQHAAHCAACQRLEADLNQTMAEIASAVPRQVTPPASLKASIMRAAIAAQQPTGAPIANRARPPASQQTVTQPTIRPRRRTMAWAAAAATILIAAGAITWGLGGRHSTTVAQRCANTNCPTITLRADGREVAMVLVLDKIAYVRADGLPATPSGRSYVLWRISDGQAPVGVAAIHTTPNHAPIKAGVLNVPINDVTAFAISQEAGNAVPPSPTDVIAQGQRE